jgi:hypothetical protein
MNKRVLIAIAAIIILAFAGLHAFNEGGEAQAAAQSGGGRDRVDIGYEGYVTVQKYDARLGEWETIAAGKHNLLVDNGKNYIRKQIGDDTSVATNSTKWISLSNDGTAPAAGWTIIPTEINVNGLSRAQATYAANGTGAWNYTYTWTATGAQSVQLTGLNYAPTAASDGNLFAALQFTSTSLQANDQLKVVWSITVS